MRVAGRTPTTRPILSRGKLYGRVGQFRRALLARPDARVDAELQRLLGSDAQWALLARLSPFDRAHHLRVYNLLREWGHSDDDLLRAALLHDVGKADDRGRVRVSDRVARVLLGRLAPGTLRRVAAEPRGGALHGLHLAQGHAARGAQLAAQAGASARCCDLIARHEQPATGDALLAALVAADALAG